MKKFFWFFFFSVLTLSFFSPLGLIAQEKKQGEEIYHGLPPGKNSLGAFAF